MYQIQYTVFGEGELLKNGERVFLGWGILHAIQVWLELGGELPLRIERIESIAPILLKEMSEKIWNYGYIINSDGTVSKMECGSYEHQFILTQKLVDAGFIYKIGDNKEIIITDWRSKQ